MSEHSKLFDSFLALRSTNSGLYDRLLGGQLDYQANLGMHYQRDFCEAFLTYLVSVEQYQTAQDFVRAFLLPRGIMNSSIVWQIYKAFRADLSTPEHVRVLLPLDIGYALTNSIANHGVSFGDIMELYFVPGWTSRFDWVSMAQRYEPELKRMLSAAPHRLPAHLWTVIKATWLLVDIDQCGVVDQRSVVALSDRIVDGYDFAKNATPAGLAMAALRNFQFPEDINNPEAYEFLENLQSPRALLAASIGSPEVVAVPYCFPCPVGSTAVKRSRRRGGRRHRKAKAAASGGAAAGAGGGR
jgi:hypothetical protein